MVTQGLPALLLGMATLQRAVAMLPGLSVLAYCVVWLHALSLLGFNDLSLRHPFQVWLSGTRTQPAWHDQHLEESPFSNG